MDIKNALSKAGRYLRDRLTKEKISAVVGFIVFAAYAAGKISPEQYQTFAAIADSLGYAMPGIGAAAILTPTGPLLDIVMGKK